MTRKFTTSIFAVCVAIISAAQTFTTTPNDTLYISNLPIGSLTIHDIYQENSTDQNLTMAWERVYVDIPATWDYSMCDLGACYPGIPEGSTMPSPNEPGYSSFLGVNLIPDAEGSGMVQINVWDIAFPDDKVLCTWYFSTGIVSVEENELANVFVYPNPASDAINLSLSGKQTVDAKIYDSNGRLIQSLMLAPGVQRITLNDFETGFYFLRLNDDNFVHVEIFHVVK